MLYSDPNITLHRFWREWLQPYMVKARRVADRGGGKLIRKILGGLWVWATWVPGNPGYAIGCREAVKITYSRLLGKGLVDGETWIEWTVQLHAASTTGGMINIDPLNPPPPQTLKDWVWESYPDGVADRWNHSRRVKQWNVKAHRIR